MQSNGFGKYFANTGKNMLDFLMFVLVKNPKEK